jgi:hypothetical protein
VTTVVVVSVFVSTAIVVVVGVTIVVAVSVGLMTAVPVAASGAVDEVPVAAVPAGVALVPIVSLAVVAFEVVAVVSVPVSQFDVVLPLSLFAHPVTSAAAASRGRRALSIGDSPHDGWSRQNARLAAHV